MKPMAMIAGMFAASALFSQTAPQTVTSMDALHFLEGRWEAKTPPAPGAPAVSGTYSFQKELQGHILARHGSNDSCKGPADFDCDHHDLFYIFQDLPGRPLKAIYFDNEGHVINYDVFASGPTKVVFVSPASTPGPRFRLLYDLNAGIMSGKFQSQLPGETEWKSYLEWSGSKK